MPKSNSTTQLPPLDLRFCCGPNEDSALYESIAKDSEARLKDRVVQLAVVGLLFQTIGIQSSGNLSMNVAASGGVISKTPRGSKSGPRLVKRFRLSRDTDPSLYDRLYAITPILRRAHFMNLAHIGALFEVSVLNGSAGLYLSVPQPQTIGNEAKNGAEIVHTIPREDVLSWAAEV